MPRQSAGNGERAPVDPSGRSRRNCSLSLSLERIIARFNLGRANAARISGLAFHTKRISEEHVNAENNIVPLRKIRRILYSQRASLFSPDNVDVDFSFLRLYEYCIVMWSFIMIAYDKTHSKGSEVVVLI